MAVFWVVLLLAFTAACSTTSPTRFDEHLADDLPALLSVLETPDWRLELQVEMRSATNDRGDIASQPYLVAQLSLSPSAQIASIGLYYRLVPMKDEGPLTTDQIAGLQQQVQQVIDGEGTGITQRYGETNAASRELAIPIGSNIDAEDIVICGVRVTQPGGSGGGTGTFFGLRGNTLYHLDQQVKS